VSGDGPVVLVDRPAWVEAMVAPNGVVAGDTGAMRLAIALAVTRGLLVDEARVVFDQYRAAGGAIYNG